MNVLVRWGKFNLVGALGMAVQLGALAALNRAAPGHYMLATLAAIELTLVHNFVWHLKYTWRDRRGRGMAGSIAMLFAKFHLANGMVSLVGNLLLMHVLVQEAHMRVLFANCVAILCCSVVNFLICHKWALAESVPHFENEARAMEVVSSR